MIHLCTSALYVPPSPSLIPPSLAALVLVLGFESEIYLCPFRLFGVSHLSLLSHQIACAALRCRLVRICWRHTRLTRLATCAPYESGRFHILYILSEESNNLALYCVIGYISSYVTKS